MVQKAQQISRLRPGEVPFPEREGHGLKLEDSMFIAEGAQDVNRPCRGEGKAPNNLALSAFESSHACFL